MAHRPRRSLHLDHVTDVPGDDDVRLVGLHTTGGTIECRWHEAPPGDTAVLWVFGAGGGFGGPAGGLYSRLSQALLRYTIAGLELAYRHPADLEPCVLDVLLGAAWLKSIGRTRVILVGHSFGGAVVINGGVFSREVIGVAALSSQSYGATDIADLAPRPVLLIHGESDEVLPDRCSRDLYRLAHDPKTLLLYPGCGHGLDACRDQLDRDLLAWILHVAER
jgi:pimeloyl-ACP methyl ester carboxylesterase